MEQKFKYSLQGLLSDHNGRRSEKRSKAADFYLSDRKNKNKSYMALVTRLRAEDKPVSCFRNGKLAHALVTRKGAELVLLTVTDDEMALARKSYSGLLFRKFRVETSGKIFMDFPGNMFTEVPHGTELTLVQSGPEGFVFSIPAAAKLVDAIYDAPEGSGARGIPNTGL